MKKLVGSLIIILSILFLTACNESKANDNNSSAKNSADYPTKPIEMIVAFDPGGSTDRVARQIASMLTDEWGQPISVVNKSGGSGTVGTVEALKARPDGYTTLMHVPTSGTLNPAMQSDMPYKWDDFKFVARVTTSPLVVIVKGDSKWETLEDLVDDIKIDPSKFTYGAAGPGAPSTFATAQIMNQAGVDPTKLTKTVFAGGSPTVTAVAGGHVDFAVQNLSEIIELVKGGKLKALAVSTEERVKVLPDVPTSKEAGFDQFTLQGWNGVVAPKDFPQDIAGKWDDTIRMLLEDEEFKEKLELEGLIPAYLTGDEFKESVRKDFELAEKIVEQLGLKN